MNLAVKAAKHSAPGQYLGFALQPVRLCYHLLASAKGSSVSLEHLDDIAIHGPGKAITLEQDKSALKHNPLADWSEDLWKTLASWIDVVEGSDMDVSTMQFRLYTTPAYSGDWASQIDCVQTDKDADEFLNAVRAKLAKKKKPPICSAFMERVLSADSKLVHAIISKTEIISEDDPLSPLRSLISATVPPMLLDLLCQAAIGMAKERADRLIRAGKAAILDGDEFKLAFISFVQKNNLPGLLTSFTEEPQPGDVQSLFCARPTFIRQLELINASSADRLKAVSDFLRSSADKSVWAEAGLIFEESLRDWDGDLVHRHDLIAGEVEDTLSDKTDVVRGRTVYRRCAQLQPPLDGRAVPGHFVHGCYNALADIKRIGWHPNSIKLLDDEGI